MEENKIKVSKHIYFNTESGWFNLSNETQEIIYRQKNLITSYSGSNEWINHFVCEMLDFCSGASIYNYALGTIKHEQEIPKIFKENKEAVINYINKTLEESWSKKMYELIDRIIDETEVV